MSGYPPIPQSSPQPTPPPSSGPTPVKSRPSRGLLWTVLARVILGIVFVVSVLLVAWTLYQYYVTIPPLGRQMHQRDSERSTLAGEVQKMEMDWNASAAEKLETEFKAARELLFADKAEQDEWMAKLQQRAAELAFEAKLVTEEPIVHPVDKSLHLVRASLELRPMKTGGGLTNSAYERLLSLNSMLENSHRRVDLVGLSVLSDSNSVAQAQAQLQLWSQVKEKATP